MLIDPDVHLEKQTARAGAAVRPGTGNNPFGVRCRCLGARQAASGV